MESTKVDLSKLSPVQKMYIDKLALKNAEFFQRAKKQKKISRLVGIILGSVALGIYTFTIVSMKQEKFLDDFEVPELPEIDKTKKSH